jgi:hypothetical protein
MDIEEVPAEVADIWEGRKFVASKLREKVVGNKAAKVADDGELQQWQLGP